MVIAKATNHISENKDATFIFSLPQYLARKSDLIGKWSISQHIALACLSSEKIFTRKITSLWQLAGKSNKSSLVVLIWKAMLNDGKHYYSRLY